MNPSLRIENNVGFIEFDHPDSKVNLLTAEVLKGLDCLVDEVGGNSSLKAVVIISKKRDVFIAGADIKEIEGITEPADGVAKAQAGQNIFNKIEDLKIPVIAVIDGVALGGGCELALACHYRIATFNEKVRIGLPEVNLGFVPGFGGTYRMPQTVGLAEGLKMIVSGRPIPAQQALKIRLVDRLYPQAGLEQQIHKFIDEIKGRPLRKEKRTCKKGMEAFLDRNSLGHLVIFKMTRDSIMKATKGFYPAPLKAVDLVQRSFYMDRSSGLKLEAEEFSKLAVTDISKNLVHVFYITEKYKKLIPPGTENVTPAPVRKCGVLGAGVMGGGIAQILAANDIFARMKDINHDAVAKGLQAAAKVFQGAVKRRRMKKYDAERKMGLISWATDYSGFGHADAVIEAVVEKMEVKKKVFKELGEIVSSHAILCTNTSALSVTEMAKETKDPSRVIGLHFFNPVHRMPLIEIITTKFTSAQALATATGLAKRLGKTPIVVKDSAGFLVNRILLSYINEAGRILEEGGEVQEIDRRVAQFGMPMGPFELSDEVGLDVGTKVLHILHDAFGERFKPVDIFEKVTAKGLLGKKAGKGFYVHEKNLTPNSEIAGMIVRKGAAGSSEEWVDRMMLTMINEAARCLEEGVVDEAAAVDVGMIMGTGFPPFRGGLLRYADRMGIEKIVEKMNGFAEKLSADRFKPSGYLLKLNQTGQRFYK